MPFRSAVRSGLGLLFLLPAWLLPACDPTPPATDAGPDAAETCETRPLASLNFVHDALGITPGATRHTEVGLEVDYCRDVEVTFTASAPGIATFPANLTIALGHSHVELEIVGVAAGTFTLTATATGPTGPVTDTIEITVVAPDAVPDCTGSGSGTAMPGTAVTSSIPEVSVLVPPGAATPGQYHVDPFPVSMACAADVVPAGYVALGPAVAFTSSAVYRFPREIQLSVPISLALLPSHRHSGHVEVAYTGPGVTTPRIVAIADPIFSGPAGRGTLRFSVPRLGTYQAVVVETPAARVSRRFVYRGIMGFSMGGSGSGRIGMGNPDMFDFVAPLGGPTDWEFMLEHIRNYHLGGFCTEAERMAGATGCDEASLARTPPLNELFAHPQTFESWFGEDGFEGPTGAFDRDSYIKIFRDLAAMFGNPNHDSTVDGVSEPDILPPGVPAGDRMLTDAERCSRPAVPLMNFFDDEYNPDGTYPVIAFCDGAQDRESGACSTDGDCAANSYCLRSGRACAAADTDCVCSVPFDLNGGEDVGNWNPDGDQNIPVEVALAVDRDGDGIRDPGEPVIRSGRENFRDHGCDRTPSTLEAGYDPLTNPDPVGDDYDFQYNPLGTEANYGWDSCRSGGMAEEYDDFGLDGVDGTCQLGSAPNCYDTGEGNGRFDRTRGGENMIASTPRAAVLGSERTTTGEVTPPLSDETMDRIDFYADGGVRDLFNWVVMGNHSMGAFAGRGLPVRYYNGHGALHADGREANEFAWDSVHWNEIGRYAMVRYGSIDATLAQLRRGDGGHVGTTDQLVSRVYSTVALMSARWPGGDRAFAGRETVVANDPASPCIAPTPGCMGEFNEIHMDFTASTGRTGPAVVVLPPYYFDPANADVEYPVMYFLHGYGMEPGDLPGLGLLMWNDMINRSIPADRRLQKMIFVFPDGRCRGDECLKGTFYTDAPANNPGGAQMQQFMLDLIEYIDATYRTRDPEVVEVWE